MSKKIKLFSQLKFEAQSEIKDCLTYGVYKINKVTHKGKLSNAILYEDVEHEYLVILDSIDVDDLDDEDYEMDSDEMDLDLD